MHQLYLCTTYAWVASPPQNEPNVRPKDKSRGGWVLPQAHVGGGQQRMGRPLTCHGYSLVSRLWGCQQPPPNLGPPDSR